MTHAVGGVLLDLAAVRDPVAVGERGDDHARASEVSILHGPGAYRVSYARRVAAEETLHVRRGLDLPLSEITWRATTSGGPGGQHANRTLSRVEVQFDVGPRPTLGPRQRARLLERVGPVVRASASDRARRRATASWRWSGWPPARCRPAGRSRPGTPRGRPRAPRCGGWRRSAKRAKRRAQRPPARRRADGTAPEAALPAQPVKPKRREARRPRPPSIWASSSGSSSARGPRSAVRAA